MGWGCMLQADAYETSKSWRYLITFENYPAATCRWGIPGGGQPSGVLPVLSDGAKKLASFFGRMASKKGGKFEAGWGRLPIPTYW